MRGSGEDHQTRSFPAFSGTIGFFKDCLRSKELRDNYLLKFKQLRKDVQEADIVWVRGPSFIPILAAGFFLGIKDKKKIHIHICANRVTWSFLLKHFSVVNLFRYFYGVFLVAYYHYMQRSGSKFYYTGSHVKSNFHINTGDYLVDFVPDYITKKPLESFSEHRAISLGRLNKLADNDEFIRFSSLFGREISVFGPGDFPARFEDQKCISYEGSLAPSDVLPTVDRYSIVVCISNEYYEGFPRVIAEAVQLRKILVVNKSSVFFEDVKHYPKLIISEEISTSDGFNEKLSTLVGASETELDKYLAILHSRSKVKLFSESL